MSTHPSFIIIIIIIDNTSSILWFWDHSTQRKITILTQVHIIPRKQTTYLFILTRNELHLVSSHLFQFAYDEGQKQPEQSGHHTGTGESWDLQEGGFRGT